jgi:hypothetical protein
MDFHDASSNKEAMRDPCRIVESPCRVVKARDWAGALETNAASPRGYLAEDMETLPTAHAGS